jgi:hypothetical protein
MEPFIKLPEFRVVICRTCKSGCVADEVISHLRDQHSAEVGPADQRRIAGIISNIIGVIRTQAELADLPLPPPTAPPIPFLQPLVEDGLQCRTCGYTMPQEEVMTKHCETAHGWFNLRKSSRVAANKRLAALPDWPWNSGV